MSMVYTEAPNVGCLAIVRFGDDMDLYSWDGHTYIYQFTLERGGGICFVREHSHAEEADYRVEYIDHSGLEELAKVICNLEGI